MDAIAMPRHRPFSESAGQIIQFRADDRLVSQLTSVAERLRTPVGVLARQWVAERLAQEIRLDQESLEKWQSQRWIEIERRLKNDMEAGPVQLLYLLPYSKEIDIDPERVGSFANSFAPAERLTGFGGRINLHGFVTEKSFASNSTKVNAYVQVFRTGQVESVRILTEDDSGKAIFGDRTDDDLIRSVWSYAVALRQLQVPLPIDVTISFHRMKGYRLRTRHSSSPTSGMEYNDFGLPRVIISDWEQVETLERVAELLYPSLKILWNAAGFRQSPNYGSNGRWKGK